MSVAFERSLSCASDDLLIALFRAGHDDACAVLMDRYRYLARTTARRYFLLGGDRDDAEQEGMIGLFKAVRDFRPDRRTSFRSFAELCVTRQVLTAVKIASRRKHQPLNRYVPISNIRDGDDAGEYSFEEAWQDVHAVDPADAVVADDGMAAMRRAMTDMLSSLEVEVLRLHVQGNTYKEIGAHLGRQAKSIDNALSRIKRKVDGHLQQLSAAETGRRDHG